MNSLPLFSASSRHLSTPICPCLVFYLGSLSSVFTISLLSFTDSASSFALRRISLGNSSTLQALLFYVSITHAMSSNVMVFIILLGNFFHSVEHNVHRRSQPCLQSQKRVNLAQITEMTFFRSRRTTSPETLSLKKFVEPYLQEYVNIANHVGNSLLQSDRIKLVELLVVRAS